MAVTPKLIALDLDETTLNQQSCLSPGNRAALEAAVSAGIEIIIASGRSLDTLPEEMPMPFWRSIFSRLKLRSRYSG